MAVQLVQPEEVLRRRVERRPFRLIDVRTPAEFAAVHAEGATPVPLDLLTADTIRRAGAGGVDERST